MSSTEPTEFSDTEQAPDGKESPKRLSTPVRINLRSMYADLREKQMGLWREIEGFEDRIAERTDLILVIEGSRQIVGEALISCGDTGVM